MDESIKVKYPAIAVKNETTGLFGNQKLIRYHQEIEVYNTKKLEIQLRIIDQVPVSDNEKIKVTLTEPASLAGAAPVNTSADHIANEVWPERMAVRLIENNCVEWRLVLKPSVKQNLALKYEISYPSSESLDGLP